MKNNFFTHIGRSNENASLKIYKTLETGVSRLECDECRRCVSVEC